MKLIQSRKELESAKKTLKFLQKSSSFDDYTNNWNTVLSNIEKCWKKSEIECKEIKNKFEPWQGNYKNKRKKDQLLKYIKNARDADNHSIQEFIEKKPPTTKFDYVNEEDRGKPITKFSLVNGILSHDGPPLSVTFLPERVECVPFTNLGTNYDIPQYHNDIKITDNKNPLVLAQLAVLFYEHYLNAIETKF
jgi:hypothetical protein